MAQGDLFGAEDFPKSDGNAPRVPLAERMRPKSFAEFAGQDEILAPGCLLRDLIEHDRVPSMILWGPPGTGKTSLARLVADKTGFDFVAFSAVLSGVKELRAIVAEAQYRRRVDGQGTILFVDEIHRFNKSQQDAFLPQVEDGTLILIGATTENPSFSLNAALLSRCHVFVLKAHDEASLAAILQRALAEPERFDLPTGISLTAGAQEELLARCSQDARTLLNCLESLLDREACRGELGRREIDRKALKDAIESGTLRYDKRGEQHFNTMSAFHKSMRGGDPQASLYWLGRMLASGEDPLWIARRIIRFASEDVGMADPQALQVALAASSSFQFLGKPEGELALAQAAVYMATAPKSNAVYAAFNEVMAELKKGVAHDVPHDLRNAPTALMKQLDYGKGYLYPHDFDDAVVDQNYLPAALSGRQFYEPSQFGFEREIKKRMDYWQGLKAKLKHKGPKE